MKKIPLVERGIPASQLVLGCMGLGGGWNQNPITAEHIKEAHDAVETALSAGINMFDHADIYTLGKAEQVFSEVLKERPTLRQDMILQSKCGIRFPDEDGPGRYDFSKSHIVRSVDGILSRLGVEYIDILLLHRPDPLMEPIDVAEAFRELKNSGKVRFFGVSNMNHGQIALLEASLDDPLIVNQLEMNLVKIGWLETGVHVNQDAARENIFPDGTLEYCQLHKKQIQAWGPLAQGLLTGKSLVDQPAKIVNTAKLVGQLAEQKGVSKEAIVLSWLMRHPAGIQPVIGTIQPARITASGQASHDLLTREEWYQLYVEARGQHLP